MSVRVFVPADSSALSVGADRVADAISDEARRRGLHIELVRTGSRGLFWLEPLVEVETAAGRVGYGPVAPGETASLFEADFLDGGAHPKALGRVDDIPYLARQQRLIFARCGLTDPLSLDDYRRHGGLRGLERALALGPKATVEEVLASGLRGRGGAGFPTGIKWRTTAGVEADQKYVVCNADEGDSGTFADRMLMEGDPFLLIEGMAIAGVSVGATQRLCLYSLRISACFRDLSASDRARAGGRPSWPQRAWLRQGVRPRSAARRRRLYLRRRNVALGEPGREARADPRQAAAAGDFRPVRQADRYQQRAELRLHPLDS